MIRKALAFIPVIAILLLGFSLRSNAQTSQWITQSGTTTLDNMNFMSIYVNASVFDAGDPTIPAQITGTINMSGSNGAYSMNVGASVKTINFGNIVWNKKTVHAAIMTTGNFYYRDLNTGVKTLAYMKVTSVQYSKGMISFMICDAATSVTLAASGLSDGQLYPYALTTGTTTIRF